jgi:uncharacterized protein
MRPAFSTFAAAACGLALMLVATSARAQTVLRFSENATIAVHPDELVAQLHAEATAPSAQQAQARVNAMIADAAAAAAPHRAQGLQDSTGFYRVWHVTEPHDQWQATQSLQLRGSDGASLLALVGALQAKGLATDSIGWQLSDPLVTRTRDAAIRQALAALRGKAEAAATVLGLHFDHFQSVSVEPENPGPPMPRAMAMAAAAAPTVLSEDIQVSATVQAEALLAPP